MSKDIVTTLLHTYPALTVATFPIPKPPSEVPLLTLVQSSTHLAKHSLINMSPSGEKRLCDPKISGSAESTRRCSESTRRCSESTCSAVRDSADETPADIYSVSNPRRHI